MTIFPPFRPSVTRQKSLALGMAGLVFIAFFAFAYHSARYAGRSEMMRAKCPACALVGHGESDLDHSEIELYFELVFFPSVADSSSHSQKPHHRRFRVRGPPVSSDQI